jgi:hypothetical protein
VGHASLFPHEFQAMVTLCVQLRIAVHFVANAGFRCYQLLQFRHSRYVAYLLRLQGSVSAQLKVSPASGISQLQSVRASIYVFSLSEGYIESMILFFILTPLSWIRRIFSSGPVWQQAGWLGGLLGVGLLFASLNGKVEYSADTFSWVICFGCLIASLRAVTEPNSLRSVWSFAGASSLLAAFAVVLQQPNSQSDVLIFVGGLVGFWLLGLGAIAKLEILAMGAKPFCRGAGNRAPVTSGVLIVAFLGVSGFRFSPTFIGEDFAAPACDQCTPLDGSCVKRAICPKRNRDCAVVGALALFALCPRAIGKFQIESL